MATANVPPQKILFTTDFSDRCRDATVPVATLASRFSAELTVLHVVPPLHAAYGPPEGGVLPDEAGTQRLVEERNLVLSAYVRDNFPGINVHTTLEVGDPASIIIEVCKADRPDLLMMPTHAHGQFRRFLIGSVTAKVLHDTDCPVWTTAHAPAGTHARPEIQKIICAVDMEKDNERQMAYARELTAALSADLMMVYAIDSGHDSDARRKQIVEKLSGIPVIIDRGKVEDVVRDAAVANNADLVILGRGGHGLLGRLRTHSYAIVRESPCPVISV